MSKEPTQYKAPACTLCNHITILSTNYDAFYCGVCNLWAENKCTDSDCSYCGKRPEKPLKKRSVK